MTLDICANSVIQAENKLLCTQPRLGTFLNYTGINKITDLKFDPFPQKAKQNISGMIPKILYVYASSVWNSNKQFNLGKTEKYNYMLAERK